MNHNASSCSANIWQSLSLREAGVSLLDCVHKTPVATVFGYPYIAIPQIKNGRIELSGARRITENDFEEWTRKAKPREFDVVLSRRCNPGETAHVPEGLECALGQNLVLLRSDGSKVHPPFLRWLVRGPEWWEQIGRFLNVGAVFDSLKCADIPNFRLSIPPRREQVRIADILGTLDDKIELNRQMNETLEAMARRLFKSWFIDFDPVHAKAALRRNHPKLSNADLSRRALPNMAPEIAELFPDSFEDSALGPIPKEWKLSRIDQLTAINDWTLGKADDLDTVDYVEISQVMKGDVGEVVRYQRGEEPSRARRRLRHGDTVLSTVRPDRGAYFIAIDPPKTLIASTGFAVFTARNVPWSWTVCALTSPDVFEFLGHHADGGAYPAVNAATIGEIEYAVPNSESLLQRFHTMAAAWFQFADENRRQSRTLAITRDKLLPKLLSGELC